MADDLKQLEELLNAPPVFVAPTSLEGSGRAAAPRYADEADMEMAATRATGFPPAPVLKDTGRRDDDGHPVFETTSLSEHNLSRGRSQAPATVPFVLPAAAHTPMPHTPTPVMMAVVPGMTSAPSLPAGVMPLGVVPVQPGVPLPIPMTQQPISLPPAAAVQSFAVSGVQNALAAIQMLESMGVIPVARGLSFRQRELLEEITRVLGKL